MPKQLLTKLTLLTKPCILPGPTYAFVQALITYSDAPTLCQNSEVLAFEGQNIIYSQYTLYNFIINMVLININLHIFVYPKTYF